MLDYSYTLENEVRQTHAKMSFGSDGENPDLEPPGPEVEKVNVAPGGKPNGAPPPPPPPGKPPDAPGGGPPPFKPSSPN